MQSPQSKFTVPAFPPFPAASRYVAIGSVEEAITRVTNGINGRDGIALIMGPPGTGKSLICNVLAAEHSKSHMVVSMGDVAVVNEEAFYRRLLHEMGVDVAAITDGDMQFALVQSLCSDDVPFGGVLLLIDEAQVMPAEVLEAIRSTTNIMKDGQPRVSAVICGSPKLDETLASASMEPFNQRVATRCYLHPLNSHETRFYITEIIRGCGSNPDATITDEAVGAIHHASNGIPRLINQMMTEAIDCAAEENETVICERIVDQAWAQLQQLPSPIVDEQKLASDAAPVEFGSLVDSVEFGELSAEVSTPEPVVQRPVAEEPVAEEPVAEEPVAEEPVAEEPVAEQPVIQEAIFQAPVMHQLVAQTAVVQQPAAMDELGFAVEPSAAPIKRPAPEVPREPIIVRSETQNVMSVNEVTDDSERVPDDALMQLRLSQPLPASIFGDFEQEVPVRVDQPSDPVAMENSRDVETRLQDDVLQLREMATQARYGGADQDNIAGDLFDVSNDSAVCPSPVWLDETPEIPAEDDFQIHLNSNDDSDLLIIEDEVDVVPKSLQQPSAATGRSMNVDYQQMLSNMRSGT